MTDEDIIIASGHVARDESVADFEPILETMIAIAQSQGRNFLAYLLSWPYCMRVKKMEALLRPTTKIDRPRRKIFLTACRCPQYRFLP